VKLSGARGGHSGADIAAGRVNAIKALGQVLEAAFEAAPFGLVRLDGGVSRNAIPRAAEAVVAVADMNAFELAARSELAAIVRQHAGTDDELVVAFGPTGAQQAAGPDETRRVLELLASIPTGAIAMSPDGSNGVETSICLTVARTQSGELLLSSMARSSNAAALDDLLARMEALARQGEAVIDVRRSYPPWEPRLDSLLLRRAAAVFDRLFGSEPELVVVHGGLECAVLGQKLESVEMISIGPEIVGLHAPGEKVRISSTERCYRLLGALVDDLSS
jgi:dipeptidase D